MRYLAFLAVLLGGCHNPPPIAEGFGTKAANLEGTYGVRSGAVIEPVLKIERTKTGYVFEERRNGEWLPDPETPHVSTGPEVLHALALRELPSPVYGLTTASAMLIKLPPGWHRDAIPGTTTAALTTQFGYVVSSDGGITDATKMLSK